MQIPIIVFFISFWVKIIFAFSVADEIQPYFAIYTLTDILILGTSLYYLFTQPVAERYIKVLGSLLMLLILNLVTFFISEIPFVKQLSLTLKIILPFLVLVFLINAARFEYQLIKKLLIYTLCLVGVVTLVGIAINPPSTNRGEMWLPIYFANLHTAAYVLSASAIASISLMRNERNVLILLTISSLTIIFGWGIRTATLCLLVIMYFHFFYYRINQKWRSIAVTNIVLVLTVVLFLLMTSVAFLEDLDDFSSGRISMYTFKFSLVSDLNALKLFFGGGAGSDLVLSNVWWWEKKGSHNDYLTIFFEQGILFLLTVLMMYFLAIRTLETSMQKSILIAYMVSGAVSNGLMLRPLPAYLCVIGIAMLIKHVENVQQKNRMLETA